MISWRTFRPKKTANDFVLQMGSLFMATWPAILTNLVSDVAGNLLRVDTSAGAWSVIAAVIASLLMYWNLRRRTDPNSQHNTPRASDSNSTHYLMQGGMFSLAIALSQVCQGVYAGPASDDQILPAIMALIPALEGAFGSQFIHIVNNQAVYYLDTALKELVLNNTRVSERMIVDHAKGLGQRHNINPFVSLSEKEINKIIRARMVNLATTGEMNRLLGPDQRISIDSFHDPNSWRIEKKTTTPAKPTDVPSHGGTATFSDKSLERQKTDDFQWDAWKRWHRNPRDHEALRELFEQTYHTKHGLAASIKFEVASMVNRILMTVVEEHRSITLEEQERVTLLRRILGEEK